MVTLLLMLMAALWVWRLYPGPVAVDPAISERVHLLESVTPVLANTREDLRLPAMTALAWLPDETLVGINDWRFEPPLKQVRLLTVQNGPVDVGPIHAGLLFSVLRNSNALSLEGAHLMVAAAGERLPDNLKIDALKLLAAKFASSSQAAVAVEIMDRAIRLADGEWGLVRHGIDLCREARRPDLALRILRNHLETSQQALPPAVAEEALNLEAHLMIQTGRARESLAQIKESLIGLEGAALNRAMERLALAATASGLPGEALEPVVQFLNSFEFHRLNPNELVHLKGDCAAYTRGLEIHARLADAAGDGRNTRDSLLRLAALGDMRYVGRLVELCRTHPRDGGWDELKTQLPDARAMARSARKAGHLNVAMDLLDLHLEREGDDQEAAFERATIEAQRTTAPAGRLRVWEAFCRNHAAHAEGLKQLARAQHEAGQDMTAFRTLGALPDSVRDPDTLAFTRELALSLGDFDAAWAAQKAIVEGLSDPSPTDYLQLARLQRSVTQGAATDSALVAGLEVHPGNPILQESLGRVTRAEVRPAQAVFAAEAK